MSLLANRIVYLDSSRRTSGTSEDYVIVQNGAHWGPPIAPSRVKLVSAAIPFTFGNIGPGNNQFNIDSTLITIPAGFYTGTQLASVIQALAGSTSVTSVTYNSTALSFTFSGGSSFSLNFTIPNSAGNVLGFGNVVVTGTSLTSTTVAGILPDYEIWVCSDLVGGSDNGVVPIYDPPSSAQVLAVVPITSCYGGIIDYRGCCSTPFYGCSASPYVNALTNNQPASIRMFLRFPSGLAVDLHGAKWTCQLNFEWGSYRP